MFNGRALVNRHANDGDDWDQATYWGRRAKVSESDGVGGLGEPDSPAGEYKAVSSHRTAARSVAAKVMVVAAGAVALLAVTVTAIAGGSDPSAGPGEPDDTEIVEPMDDYPRIDPIVEPPMVTVPGTAPGTLTPTIPGTAPRAGAPARTQAARRAPGRQQTTPTRPAPPPRTSTTSKPANPATSTTPRAGIVVRLVNSATGKSVGVSRSSTADGAKIVQGGGATDRAAQWRLLASHSGCYHLINVKSRKAMDNPDGTSTNGVQMQQWTYYWGNYNQSWCFRSIGAGRYSIRNLTSGFLLDVKDGRSADGTWIQQWNADPAAPNANQTWRLFPVG